MDDFEPILSGSAFPTNPQKLGCLDIFDATSNYAGIFVFVVQFSLMFILFLTFAEFSHVFFQ